MVSVSKKDNKYFINIRDDSTLDVQSIEIVGRDPKNPNILHLPANPSNRQWLSCTKVDNAPGQVLDLAEKASITHKNGPVERKPIKADIEYLSDEDKVIYQSLMDKIAEAKAIEREAKKADDKRQKLINQIANLQAILAEMGE